MIKFGFTALTQSPERLNVISTKLGATTTDGITEKDIGKAMKLNLAIPGSHVFCEDGDDIEGFLDNIDAGGTEDGFVFGGVASGTRGMRAEVAFTGTLAVGDLVVAGVQPAIGTEGLAVVKAGTPTLHKWRVIGSKPHRADNKLVAGDTAIIVLV